MNEKLKNEALNRLSVNEFKSAIKQPIIVVLDNVRSLNNVGSAFRTADAFLIEEIILCGLTGTPPNKEIEKTAKELGVKVNDIPKAHVAPVTLSFHAFTLATFPFVSFTRAEISGKTFSFISEISSLISVIKCIKS